MSRLILVDAKTLEKLLFLSGFVRIRQRGSHVFYRHADGRYTTIPHHGSAKLSRPLLHQILKQIMISAEDYTKLIESL